MKRFIELCFFQTQYQLSHELRNTQATGLTKVFMIKKMLDHLYKNFFKYGKGNGFVLTPNDNEPEKLGLFIATPIDVAEMLANFQNLNKVEQDHYIKQFQGYTRAWTTTYNFPDENCEDPEQLFRRLMPLYMERKKEYYNNPQNATMPYNGPSEPTSSTGEPGDTTPTK